MTFNCKRNFFFSRYLLVLSYSRKRQKLWRNLHVPVTSEESCFPPNILVLFLVTRLLSSWGPCGPRMLSRWWLSTKQPSILTKDVASSIFRSRLSYILRMILIIILQDQIMIHIGQRVLYHFKYVIVYYQKIVNFSFI